MKLDKLEKYIAKLVPKRTNFMAIDIGAREIKAIEIKSSGGKTEVIKIGRIPTPPDTLEDLSKGENLITALKQLMSMTGIQNRIVVTAIAGDKVITRQIKMPVMTAKELETAVKFEAEKHIPIPLKDLILSYVKLGEIEVNNAKQLNVLLAAVPSNLVYQYYNVFAQAGLEICAIDLQPLALWRSLGWRVEEGQNNGTLALADIGATTTQFVVVKNGLFQFTRSIPVGGNNLTEALSGTLSLDLVAARKLQETAGEILFEEGSDDPRKIQMDVILRRSLSDLVHELKRSIDFHKTQDRTSTVDKLIITGGASKLKGLPDFLTEELGLPVNTGSYPVNIPDNLAAFRFDKSSNHSLDPSCAIALGLALREVVE